MNKNLNFFLFLGLILLIFYLCKDKIESFGNPFDPPFNPLFDYHIPTPDQDINTGYKQERICFDDRNWRKTIRRLFGRTYFFR